ncbi:MAG: VOC family protein [Parvibaculaceae bacterium]
MGYVRALGYMGLSVTSLDQWKFFATDFLGAQTLEGPDGAIDLRLDDYSWRIRINETGNDDVDFLGWEVDSAHALDALKSTLETNGVSFEVGTESDAANRRVEGLIKFADPLGVAQEAYFGPRQRTESPFQSPLGLRFKTGAQGLGHVVLNCENPAAMEAWYRDNLGMKVSDYIYQPTPFGTILNMTFMRCNSRHHSMAFAGMPLPKKLQHFMLEVEQIDDVGRSLYRAQEMKVHNSMSLGRHSNDEMLSAYYSTPSGFDVEVGWGGLEVQDETWHVLSHDRGSAWGHEFKLPTDF